MNKKHILLNKTKIVGIVVCTLLILTSISITVSAEINENKIGNSKKTLNNEFSSFNTVVKGVYNKKTENKLDDNPIESPAQIEILDQYMDQTNNYGWYVLEDQWIAQGFKPTLDTLTRVDLYYFRSGNPSDDIKIIVSIRDDLYGSDIVSATVNAGQIPHQGIWIKVDLQDIPVVPEQKYYIVCKATGGDWNNVYCWYCDFNNPYTRGDAWGSPDQGFTWWLMDNPPETPQTDCCFKTYGLIEKEFKITFISGEISDLATYDGYKSFKAEKILRIQFLPLKFQRLSSEEIVYVLDRSLGLLTSNLIIGLFKSSL
jgi:hypothetical protein